jgi:hypothetical protein
LEVLSQLNFDELCGIALSHLYITVDGFYDLTPIEFKYALKSVRERETDQFKTKYEVARYLAYHVWNSAGKSIKGHIKEPKEVGLFGWEAEDQLYKQQSVEDIKHNLFSIFGRAKKLKDKRTK